MLEALGALCVFFKRYADITESGAVLYVVMTLLSPNLLSSNGSDLTDK